MDYGNLTFGEYMYELNVWQTHYDHELGGWHGQEYYDHTSGSSITTESYIGKITHWMELPEKPKS